MHCVGLFVEHDPQELFSPRRLKRTHCVASYDDAFSAEKPDLPRGPFAINGNRRMFLRSVAGTLGVSVSHRFLLGLARFCRLSPWHKAVLTQAHSQQRHIYPRLDASLQLRQSCVAACACTWVQSTHLIYY